MEITDEAQRRVERRIDIWRSELEAFRRNRETDLVTDLENRLFGMQMALHILGLKNLACVAEAAQKVDTNEGM